MADSPAQSHQTSKLSVWWKILIGTNVVFDIPILFYALTGYQWSCNFNQRPDYIFPILAGILTLTLIWLFIRNVVNDPKFFDIITTGLFSVLICIAVCYSSLAIPLMYLEQIGSGVDAAVPSPNGQRIAELCSLNCGDSCLTPYYLRVSYRLFSYVDLNITRLKFESPDYFKPRIKWIDNNTISVTEAGNTTRIFHASPINFNWQYILVFCCYVGSKYIYVINRLRRRF